MPRPNHFFLACCEIYSHSLTDVLDKKLPSLLLWLSEKRLLARQLKNSLDILVFSRVGPLVDLWKAEIPYIPVSTSFFFLKIYLLIDWLIAMLGLRFCARAFSSCGKRYPLFIVVRGPLTIAASLVAEHRLQTRRLSSCGSRAQLLRVMWDLPRPGLEPVSPALAGRFSTTAPPGKPNN